MKSYEILLGLPGSGKTRYAKMQSEKYKSIAVFDADEYMLSGGKTLQNLVDILLEMDVNTHIIIDGLFPDNTANTLRDMLSQGTEECYITQFDGKMDICLINDKHRRDIGERATLATQSIKKIRIASMKVDKIVNTKTPYILPNVLSGGNGFFTGTARSEDWDAGGSTYGSCWDDEDTVLSVSEAEEPSSLNEFYEFMEFRKNYTSLGVDDFIEKYKHFVTMDSESEGDYYGGCAYMNFWVFDRVTLLAEILDISEHTLEENFKEDRPGDYVKLFL